MYNIGDKVRTGYGIGKIVDKKVLEAGNSKTNCYLIKYRLFKKLWCFEDSIEERFSRWI